MRCITYGIGGRSAALASLKLSGRLEMDSARREIVVRIIQLVTEQLKGVERRLRPDRCAQPNFDSIDSDSESVHCHVEQLSE